MALIMQNVGNYVTADSLTNIDRIVMLLDGLNAPTDITGPMLRPGSSRSRPTLRTVS
ncbi:hypothetical protein SAMN04490357_1444 [Streptomyces misionensis]|uniref:Uncharacterized protein n=1 Tax=Streptomyces misionensis TaxID=67331 RepID=A0A1H4QM54_9ACTN|nr:hypothetical protein [Streptomyces misionensis]SEC20689.1 hypothetical protein SAMN04490357_1444 [Streptomyces misionensis]